MPRLQFLADPADFLAAAGAYLAADPVVNTVVTTVAHRQVAEPARSERDWWLIVTDDVGAVVGAGMRSARFAPYPAFLLPMPDAAAVSLAHAWHDRGEEIRAINGALPTVQLCAAEVARLAGGRVEVGRHTRLHVLGELVPPSPVPGRLVAAGEADSDLVTEWFA